MLYLSNKSHICNILSLFLALPAIKNSYLFRKAGCMLVSKIYEEVEEMYSFEADAFKLKYYIWFLRNFNYKVTENERSRFNKDIYEIIFDDIFVIVFTILYNKFISKDLLS